MSSNEYLEFIGPLDPSLVTIFISSKLSGVDNIICPLRASTPNTLASVLATIAGCPLCEVTIVSPAFSISPALNRLFLLPSLILAIADILGIVIASVTQAFNLLAVELL